MRTLLAAAFLFALGLEAQAFDAPINLDRPGALAALQKERPEHYRAVLRTVRAAERMHCGVDYKLLRIGDRNPCGSYMIRTSYPAQVSLSIPLDEARYVITAYLDASRDHLSPAK